ncbi:hypothetical protein SY85_14235 [Flavisolibacter tropicus]|uniref:Uncharacterized protein n=1 Tax=Flavisolibacter tropicus TaxID=1492898 RepID=A0A172TWT5_9BACT|nr:hypothetical protein SY85_14235 [Flavisolibacter tropicus]
MQAVSSTNKMVLFCAERRTTTPWHQFFLVLYLHRFRGQMLAKMARFASFTPPEGNLPYVFCYFQTGQRSSSGQKINILDAPKDYRASRKDTGN